MTQWMKESIKTSGTVDKSWKLHHVPVMSPLKPGKNNNYPRSWYKNILIWDNIYSHIYWFIAAAGPFAFLQSQCQLYAVFEPYSRVLCETYLYQMYLILPSVSLGSLKIQPCLSITTWPESFGLKFLCTHNNNNKKKDRVRRLFSLSVLHRLSSLPFLPDSRSIPQFFWGWNRGSTMTSQILPHQTGKNQTYLIDLALRSGALSCYKRKGPSPTLGNHVFVGNIMSEYFSAAEWRDLSQTMSSHRPEVFRRRCSYPQTRRYHMMSTPWGQGVNCIQEIGHSFCGNVSLFCSPSFLLPFYSWITKSWTLVLSLTLCSNPS